MTFNGFAAADSYSLRKVRPTSTDSVVLKIPARDERFPILPKG